MAEVYQRHELFNKLEEINPQFDAINTLRVGFSHFGIKDKDGSYRHCGGFGAFCKTWCEKYGEYIDYSTKGSFQSGKLFYMTWKNLDKVGKKDAVQEQKEIGQVKELSEEKVEMVVEVSEEPVKVDLSTLPEIDWAWVDSLSNSKYSKAELETYAKPYGIDLKKNNSIDNMRKVFREHMGVSVE